MSFTIVLFAALAAWYAADWALREAGIPAVGCPASRSVGADGKPTPVAPGGAGLMDAQPRLGPAPFDQESA